METENRSHHKSTQFPFNIGPKNMGEKDTQTLYQLAAKLTTPFTTGDSLHSVGHEWTIRHLQYSFGNNYFNNSRVVFFSGISGLEGMLKSDDFVRVRDLDRIARRTAEKIVPQDAGVCKEPEKI